MDMIEGAIRWVNGMVWGWPALILIVGVGLFLTVQLRLLVPRKLPMSLSLLWKGRDKTTDHAGDITPFQSLMTAMSATIGTGNIAGVATAISIGGPGAVFWMWITAVVGMTTKYAEAVLAVRYRVKDSDGGHHGGPMYYILHGLGEKWRWLAAAFAGFAVLAAFGIGNTIQVNSMASAMQTSFDISPVWIAVAVLVLVFVVVIGGVKRIGEVAGKLVPIMAISYFTIGIIVVVMNIENVPAAFSLIFQGAFGYLEPVAGGAAGYAVAQAVRYGIARGVFSNEAGLGSAPIAHAAAKTHSPINQGLIASLGTFFDTLIVCTVTALVILTGDAWMQVDESGAPAITGATLTLTSVSATLGTVGRDLVTIALAVFAFTTILGWGVYGEKCLVYLTSEAAAKPFRYVWALASPIGALVLLGEGGTVAGIDLVWLIADTLNAFMALPNLIALALLSPVVLEMTRAHFAQQDSSPPPVTPEAKDEGSAS